MTRLAPRASSSLRAVTMTRRPVESRKSTSSRPRRTVAGEPAGGAPVVPPPGRHPRAAPAAVVHDERDDGQAEAGGGVELHGVEAEGAVAHGPHPLRSRPAQGGRDREAHAVADVPEVA